MAEVVLLEPLPVGQQRACHVPPVLTVLRVPHRVKHVPTVLTALLVQRCVHHVLTQPIVLVRVIRAVRGIQPKESVTTVIMSMSYSMVCVFLILM